MNGVDDLPWYVVSFSDARLSVAGPFATDRAAADWAHDHGSWSGAVRRNGPQWQVVRLATPTCAFVSPDDASAVAEAAS